MIVADSAVALGSLVLAGLFLTGRASTTVVLEPGGATYFRVTPGATALTRMPRGASSTAR